MPFTFSHPAIVLPLRFLPKNWISVTGLIIGSLTPDFEYFLRMKIESNYSHTFLGIFWFNMPLGVFLAFLFHNLVKNQWCNNLPKMLADRFLKMDQLNWNQHFVKNWKIILISIFIGILSHLFWDGFTHKSGFFVQNISALAQTIEIFHYPIKIFKILQHLSTLIGAILISFTIWKLPKIANSESNINAKYWIILGVITFSIFALRLLIGENSCQIGNLIVSLLSSGMIGLLIVPIILNNKSKI